MPTEPPDTASHYFDESPDTPSKPVVIDFWLPDGHLSLTTDRGVFGYGQVDAGSKLLLRTAPTPHGTMLDVGCGAGAIALTMARRAPEGEVWAVDVNERALDLCRSNASANGLTNVNVAAPDDVPAETRFDTIWSNPPIRIGKEALHALLVRWLGRLQPEGEAWLVVHKHLGSDSLQRWLADAGFPAERVASSSGYRILRCTVG